MACFIHFAASGGFYTCAAVIFADADAYNTKIPQKLYKNDENIFFVFLIYANALLNIDFFFFSAKVNQIIYK